MRAPNLLTALALTLAIPAQAEEVVVLAAASMKTALDDMAAAFQAETGHTVTLAYGGSAALAKQIIAGAPADIFISAAPEWMDAVDQAGALKAGSRQDILGNRLVLIAHDKAAPQIDLGPGFNLAGLLGQGKLSMAMVDAVPAGQYGKAALESLGLWDAVAPNVAQAENVRAAMALVSMGEAPFGIVYASDALADPSVTVVATFPADSHPPIRISAALTATVQDPSDLKFFESLAGEKAKAKFAGFGFQVLP